MSLASSLHFDLRLEIGDVLRSWAVPKGPTLDPAVRRLAVPVEDHSLAAGEFEGVHERQTRGSGAVIIWDEGTVEILRDEPDHLSFALHGHKRTGRFGLSREAQVETFARRRPIARLPSAATSAITVLAYLWRTRAPWRADARFGDDGHAVRRGPMF